MPYRTPILAFVLAALTVPALADPGAPEGPENIGVMSRPRPDYDAKGLPFGAFRLKPALDIGVASDDNIFASETAAEDDVYYRIAPSFDLMSDWSRHRLELKGSLARYEYQTHDSENRTDWNVEGSGRLDVIRGTFIDGEASYAVLHEPRYSADEPGGAERPTQYAQVHAAAAITHAPTRFGVQVGVSYDRFRYDATPLIGGGEFDNDDRNESQYDVFAKLSYEFQPGAAVFIRGSMDEENYVLELDRDGVDRDSRRYRADIGAQFFATHLIRGEVFAGYVNQRFEDPLPNVSTVDYGAALDWFATALVTFHLRVARLLNDTTIAGAAVSDDQTAKLSLDYELMRNVIVHAGGDFTRSRFKGTDRADELWGGGISVDYLVNEYLSANASYRYLHRNSNVPGEDFEDNTILAGLHFQL